VVAVAIPSNRVKDSYKLERLRVICYGLCVAIPSNRVKDSYPGDRGTPLPERLCRNPL